MTIRNLKRIATGVAMVGLLMGGASASVARDWDHRVFIIYYSDEDHTTEVGSEYHPCSGPWEITGEITRYPEYFEIPGCS